jgi:hypothetical protein
LRGLLPLVITNNANKFCDHKHVRVQLNYASWSNYLKLSAMQNA